MRTPIASMTRNKPSRCLKCGAALASTDGVGLCPTCEIFRDFNELQRKWDIHPVWKNSPFPPILLASFNQAGRNPSAEMEPLTQALGEALSQALGLPLIGTSKLSSHFPP